MIYPSQFGGGFPLGATIQGVGLSEPQWVQRDGKARLRSAYPRLSTLFPIGKMTGTVRTLAATPGIALVAASPNYFVASTTSTATTTALQYSSDGISYSVATTPTFTPAAIEWCGNRFVAISSTANQPIVTTGDAPNGTWSSTTSGPSSVAAGSSVCRLAYSPTLGRVLAVSPGGSAVHTLENAATAWVSRAVSAGNRQGACWTGNKFLVVLPSSAVLESSPDGAGSWTTVTMLEATSASQGNIASDGNGTVVVSGCPSGLQVSTDHGVTWDIVPITGIPQSDTWRVRYVGDRFVAPTSQGVAMSLDGRKWFLDTQSVQAFSTASCVAKKGSVFAQVQASTVAYTFAESATEFIVPALRLYTSSPAGTPIPIDPSFIKAL